MKKLLTLLFVIITLSSCSDDENKQKQKFVCNCEQRTKMEKFIKETIGDANNMSDEEMEDVIYQLERTSVRLHCSQKFLWYTHDNNIIPEKNDLDEKCDIVINHMY